MLKVWQKAKELGLSSIPSNIANHAGYVPWHDSWQRPLLGEYFRVGLEHYNKGDFEDAYWIFSHLLELSPNDNQGARYFAINCCFEFGRHVAVINICKRFPEYYEGYLYFAKALALFSTHEKEPVEKQIIEAVREFPKYAKLIAQKRKRDHYELPPDGVIVGSKEEAQEYWNMQGKYWRQNPEAVETVRSIYEAQLKRSYRRKNAT